MLLVSNTRAQHATIDSAKYLKLFLDEHDLPQLKKNDIHQWMSAFQDDPTFAQHQGIAVGMVQWDGQMKDTDVRIVDIRWVFPNDSSANSYINETWDANSEHAPLLSGSPSIGDVSRMFHTLQTIDFGGHKVEMNWYYYLFRMGRVVTKLFVSQSAEGVTNLSTEDVQILATKIASHIHESKI